MGKEQKKPLSQAEVDAIIADWGAPADFSGRLLVGIALSHNRSLEMVDFRGATLRGCTFSHCKFDNSNFENADLGDTAFIRCKMEFCHFNGAQMENADFDRCALMGSTGINGDTRMQSEVVFEDTVGMIRGIDMALAPGWRQFAWEMCGADQESYDSMLHELQENFHEIDNTYPGMGAEIFNSRLHFLPRDLRAAANFIANGNTVGAACQLAAQGVFTGAEPLPEHEMFVLPHSDVQNNLLAERAFVAQVKRIHGVDFGKLHDWLGLARELGDGSGEGYRQHLREFGTAFAEIERSYDGVAAAMFNHEAGYLPSEMLPAAEWIAGGGSAEEAVEMARDGDFLDLDPADFEQAEGPVMTM